MLVNSPKKIWIHGKYTGRHRAQVPDVDALITFPDMPRVRFGEGPTGAPLFAGCSNDKYAEVPFPDFTYFAGQARAAPATLP